MSFYDFAREILSKKQAHETKLTGMRESGATQRVGMQQEGANLRNLRTTETAKYGHDMNYQGRVDTAQIGADATLGAAGIRADAALGAARIGATSRENVAGINAEANKYQTDVYKGVNEQQIDAGLYKNLLDWTQGQITPDGERPSASKLAQSVPGIRGKISGSIEAPDISGLFGDDSPKNQGAPSPQKKAGSGLGKTDPGPEKAAISEAEKRTKQNIHQAMRGNAGIRAWRDKPIFDAPAFNDIGLRR